MSSNTSLHPSLLWLKFDQQYQSGQWNFRHEVMRANMCSWGRLVNAPKGNSFHSSIVLLEGWVFIWMRIKVHCLKRISARQILYESKNSTSDRYIIYNGYLNRTYIAGSCQLAPERVPLEHHSPIIQQKIEGDHESKQPQICPSGDSEWLID